MYGNKLTAIYLVLTPAHDPESQIKDKGDQLCTLREAQRGIRTCTYIVKHYHIMLQHLGYDKTSWILQELHDCMEDLKANTFRAGDDWAD